MHIKPLCTLFALIFFYNAVAQSRFTSVSYNNQHTYVPGERGFPISIFSYVSAPDPSHKALFSWGDGFKSSVSMSQSCFMDVYYYKHPGIYEVKIVMYDKTFNKALDSTRMTVLAFCNHFSTHIFQSDAGNCAYNPAQDSLSHLPVVLDLRKNGVLVGRLKNGDGFMKDVVAEADLVSVFSLTPSQIPEGYTLACPAKGSYTFRFDTLNSANNVFDFRIKPGR